MSWMLVGAAVIGCGVAGVWYAPRLSRLIGTRDGVEADLPCAFGFKMAWVAVKTRDTARLISVLGIDNAKPTGWSLGIGTVYSDRLGLDRVFVTPPIEGWSFVVSLGLPLPMGEAYVDKATALVERLSAEFGLANAYASFPALGFYAWAAARHGELERAFAIGREGVVANRGAITPEERLLAPEFFTLAEVAPHGEWAGYSDSNWTSLPMSLSGSGPSSGSRPNLWAPFTENDVMEVARLWSLDPTRFGERTDLDRGTGYLALVPPAWRAELVARKAA